MITDHSKNYGFGDDVIFKGDEKKPTDMPSTKPVKRSGGGQSMSSTSFNVPFQFVESGRRNQVMVCEGEKYIQNNKYGDKIYWKCSRWHDKCKARAITLLSQPECIIRRNEHNHSANTASVKDDVKLEATE